MNVLRDLQDPDLVQLYASGKVGVLPTDTIYGLTASAKNPQAVARLYALKQREQKPGTVIAASVAQLQELGIAVVYLKQVERLWPNPLSIQLPVGPQLDYLSQGTGHCAFRVVTDGPLRTLLQETGPLLTSSANHPGGVPANNIAEAITYFTDRVDFYVDGGEIVGRPPSTVARLNPGDGTLTVVRQGTVILTEDGGLA